MMLRPSIVSRPTAKTLAPIPAKKSPSAEVCFGLALGPGRVERLANGVEEHGLRIAEPVRTDVSALLTEAALQPLDQERARRIEPTDRGQVEGHGLSKIRLARILDDLFNCTDGAGEPVTGEMQHDPPLPFSASSEGIAPSGRPSFFEALSGCGVSSMQSLRSEVGGIGDRRRTDRRQLEAVQPELACVVCDAMPVKIWQGNMMARRLSVTVDRFPLARRFTIARGSKTEAVVVTCRLEEGSAQGWGECVPYARYGEKLKACVPRSKRCVARWRPGRIARRCSRSCRRAPPATPWTARFGISKRKPPGERRRAPRPGPPARDRHGLHHLARYAGRNAQGAAAVGARSVLKVKVGAPEGDAERMRAVRAAAPQARLIIDANEGWRPETIRELMLAAASIGAFVVEQPSPPDRTRSSPACPARCPSVPTNRFMAARTSRALSGATTT